MRPDGDPERDDYGLPRVDVVIPDDARELERDLIAYRREQRRRRLLTRAKRLARPFARFGIAVPLAVGALIIALASGTLLTIMGPRPAPQPSGDALADHPGASVGEIGGLLPAGAATIVTGRTRRDVSVRDLRSGVIGIVPPDCRCPDTVAALARSTHAHVLNFWLVTDGRRAKESAQRSLRALRALAGASHDGLPGLVEDRQDILAAAYAPPAAKPDPGLTAVLVYTDGVVADVIPRPQAGPGLDSKIERLRSASTRPPG